MKKRNTQKDQEKAKKGAIYTGEHIDYRNKAMRAARDAQAKLVGKKLVRVNAKTWVYE